MSQDIANGDMPRAIGEQLRREQMVIAAMHQKPWYRAGILARRPWRSALRRQRGESTLAWAWAWLTVVHDCADPAVGCSCSGSFRFPIEPMPVALASYAAPVRSAAPCPQGLSEA